MQTTACYTCQVKISVILPPGGPGNFVSGKVPKSQPKTLFLVKRHQVMTAIMSCSECLFYALAIPICLSRYILSYSFTLPPSVASQQFESRNVKRENNPHFSRTVSDLKTVLRLEKQL